jgi:hypothetical protein
MSLLEMERLTAFTREEIGFALWYLREKSMARQTDDSQYCICAEGVDFVESNPGHPELLAIAAPSLTQGHLMSNASQVPPEPARAQGAILL